MKKRLLIWSDSPTVKTGFGVVSANLFRDLHEQYDVAILGINYFGLNRYDTQKYFIYPVDSQDVYGLERMTSVLSDFNPDLILLFQDIFTIETMLPVTKKWNETVPILGYYPIDGTPVSKAWGRVFKMLDKNITYTQWAIDSILEVHPELKEKKIEYLYHGVDLNVFRPLPDDQIHQLRKEKGWDDKFLAISNNRFQPRKNLAGLLRIWAMFAKGYKECKCGNYYVRTRSRCDLNGCGPENVLNEYPGHDDVILYLHCNTQEPAFMGRGVSNILQMHMINAGFENQDVNRIVAVYAGNVYQNPLSEEELNCFYNMANVNVSTTLGEGIGFSLIESAACGTPSIAPKNSAVPEMLGDTGHIIPNLAFANFPGDNAHMRPLVNPKKFIEALEVEYGKWKGNGKRKIIDDSCTKRVVERFQWQDKRDLLLRWLNEFSGVALSG